MKANKSKTTYIYCKFLKDCMCSYFYCPNCIENPFREEPDIDQELMDDLDSCSFDYDGHKVMFTKAAYNICNRIKTFDNKLNNNNMETITIELGGRKYKVSPVEEEATTIDQFTQSYDYKAIPPAVDRSVNLNKTMPSRESAEEWADNACCDERTDEGVWIAEYTLNAMMKMYDYLTDQIKSNENKEDGKCG